MEKREQEPMPFLQLVPNLVTIAALCLGLTAIRFAMVGRFELAVSLILLAALLDGLDGLIARRLRATSDFGAELDSLSDFLNFGVAPGLLVYRFALGEANSLGWIFVLIYAVAGCLRLARFNVMRGAPETSSKHFVGVPAPAGAMLALFPVFLSLSGLVPAQEAPMIVAIWLGVVGVLMISRLPTFSPKALRIPRGRVGLILIGTAIAMGILFTRFWMLMVLVDLAYLAALLPAVWRARRQLLR
ncbi:CDP-diacylglycerol--serine O-phosphatidyltransferase [Phaeovulum sp. NW3]|uniref:CDP-diacylglycerol--serine O-phosphatidyltransferase n=1 Tax=Phaeovulum sp. NW3 TaxID=2934933 RepID=UPI00202039C0|nr:CDP-diacylglycerol--serine O-phosphatidyltransferase [Phaeovulum sp. NW3]MCL7465767.1 CDP-diacylglycerol--serine O-phosphatidyltransferase [Phaeovulum sp. NW3]